jgi:choline dehydrogenase
VDIALVLEQLPAVTPEAAAKFGAPPPNTFVIAPALVRPESRGSIRLASANWKDPIVIDGNYLGTDRDLNVIVRGIELARELGSQSAFDGVRARELVPGPQATSDDIRELARLASASFGHPVGTCKIGSDEMARAEQSAKSACSTSFSLGCERPSFLRPMAVTAATPGTPSA